MDLKMQQENKYADPRSKLVPKFCMVTTDQIGWQLLSKYWETSHCKIGMQEQQQEGKVLVAINMPEACDLDRLKFAVKCS